MIKQITTEEMRALLAKHPEMSEPTRHVLITGQATFVDASGVEYQAPITRVDDGPTHRANGVLVPVSGDPTKCN